MEKALVTGGAGYVGCVLVPKLLAVSFQTTVLDLFIYGEEVFGDLKNNSGLSLVKGDIRDQKLLRTLMADADVLIHLACISNDPSFELNPDLGKSINYEATLGLAEVARESHLKLFINVSSSSVYGIQKEGEAAIENSPLRPITDYSRCKLLSEQAILEKCKNCFPTTIIRPATICGWSPRLRLDLVVNILTNHAWHNNKIFVDNGGVNMRPNIHIEDITDYYVDLIYAPIDKIAGQVFNAGAQNHTILELAQIVKQVVEQEKREEVRIELRPPGDDNRSYAVSSQKIKEVLGFAPRYSVKDAVRDLCQAFRDGKAPNSMTDDRYYNVKRMSRLELK